MSRCPIIQATIKANIEKCKALIYPHQFKAALRIPDDSPMLRQHLASLKVSTITVPKKKPTFKINFI